MGLPKYEGMPQVRVAEEIEEARLYYMERHARAASKQLKRYWQKLSRRASKNVVNLELISLT